MVQAQAAPAAQIEYTIYTFDLPKGKQKGQSQWKKQATIEDMDKALAEAQKLYESEKYQKIEVKKKFFDVKKNRNVDMTLKVYELKPKKDMTGVFVMLFAVLCGAGAFALTYFLGQSS